MLLDAFPINGDTFLEPCAGQGHISTVIQNRFPNANVTNLDIVDRGYPSTFVCDFLQWCPDKEYDCVITNPPYSLATEFVWHSMECVKDDGLVMMFLKVQFLEGKKREWLFEKYPPKYVYVFRNRMATWNNGYARDPNGKRWATTMCHAWFVWQKGYAGEPVIRWL